jgi:hypothetical protein
MMPRHIASEVYIEKPEIPPPTDVVVFLLLCMNFKLIERIARLV